MKSVFVALCLAAGFADSCASNTDTSREWPPVHLERNGPPSLSPEVDPRCVSAVAPGDSGTPTQVPDYYLGVGARGLKGDPFAAVIGAKLKLFDLDALTLSTRPAVLLGGYDDEWSLPFTLEGKVNSYGFAWFGGAGLRHGMDDLGETDPMVTGGIDLPLRNRLVLNVTINYMWQTTIDDLDGELLVSINYGF
jgi:hypothetical protein